MSGPSTASLKPSLTSRIRGSFYGLAATDAIGAPVEFKVRGTFPQVTSYQPNLNFSVNNAPIPPGAFTDDTSMALCLAHSLIDHNGNSDTVEQVRKYLAWYKHGYMSSVGECFDVGAATSSALKQWDGLLKTYDNLLSQSSTQQSHSPPTESATTDSEQPLTPSHMLSLVSSRFLTSNRCGNGSLMRVLPCALITPSLPQTIDLATQSCLPTHPHPRCIQSCTTYAQLIHAALTETSKVDLAKLFSHLISTSTEEGFKTFFSPYNSNADPLHPWHTTPSTSVLSSGYVLHTLHAALWSFFTTTTFRDGAIKVVNLGDDADTVGAVYGGLAGAFYGEEGIPEVWRRELRGREMVEGVLGGILRVRGDV
jgi:ADP-ribosyl-[dinitrogen reductase] hydrolase